MSDVQVAMAFGLLAGFIVGMTSGLLIARSIVSAALNEKPATPAERAAERAAEWAAGNFPVPPLSVRPDGTFLAFVFDNAWGAFVLLEVAGPMLKVQEHTDGTRPGRIATINLNQVHQHDRKRVAAMMAAHPGGRAEFTFDPLEDTPGAPPLRGHHPR
jgi:hypothetical protein